MRNLTCAKQAQMNKHFFISDINECCAQWAVRQQLENSMHCCYRLRWGKIVSDCFGMFIYK